ncbi:uncharacterized protein LOC100907050 [Galendromus occidentalis]|uniref:Uncharacterized protein LOC100907050 n=1 Tax=Galendromus occidentalis TaxID=34638 RepID=A0AAJ6QYY1_9ACAR|nr:uncharacterized protein LOC100907050 [Galendromus occidentalis]
MRTVCAVSVFVISLFRCDAEDPNFMEQVMPDVCKTSQNFTERIWHLACIEHLMGYYLEDAADDCFKIVQNLTGWAEVMDILCARDEFRGSSSIMTCFSRHVSAYLMFDARDVDKITRQCRHKSPPEQPLMVVE